MKFTGVDKAEIFLTVQAFARQIQTSELKINALNLQLQDEADKDLVDALPLIHPERTNNNVTSASATPLAAHNAEPFCDTQAWNTSCHCTPRTPKDDQRYREANEPLIIDSTINPASDHHRPPDDDVDDDQPLDCSASVCEEPSKQQQQQIDFPEYKPDISQLISTDIRHLTPEVECIQRSTAPPSITTIPHPEQENMDTMINPQLMPYAATHCQSDPVGKETMCELIFIKYTRTT